MRSIFSILIFTIALISKSLTAQINNTLTLYSEFDEPFIMTINGEQMSEDYVKRIKFDTDQDYVSATIKFKNPELPEMVRKYIHIAGVGDDSGKPASSVYKIYRKEKKKKGEMVTLYKIGFISRSFKKMPVQTVILQSEPRNSDGVTIQKGNVKVKIGG